MDKNKNIELLLNKEVDYSMFSEGIITVRNDILPRFLEVEAGKQKKINVQVEENIYQVELRHINRKNASTVYQIRYSKNGKLSAHLVSLFPEAYQLLNQQCAKGDQKKTYAKLPKNKKEYLLIYYDKKNKKLIWQRQENESFYPIIQKFIKQADETRSLKVSDYPKIFQGLEVKVSFGQRGYYQIPSISFLYEGQTISDGIYPCFLYYKEQRLLILAYTINGTIKPPQSWDLPARVQTIDSYFDENNLKTPDRYGKSFVHEVYSVDNPFQEQIDKNLQEIIDYYKTIMEKTTTSISDQRTDSMLDIPFKIDRVEEIGQTGLLFNSNLLYRYTTSLLTKPFVILSGLSGSGKTKLALSFAKWITGNRKQVKIVSVGSDWNNREYLLGYPNALQPGEYIKPDNGVLDFIIEAEENKDLPYFLILDEMNLSYVERYFADFLSTMESQEPITLHPDTASDSDWSGVPSTIRLPKNLYITGTINVDETTYMFSPKVLDRANVIEFRISQRDMETFLRNCTPIKPDAADHKGADMQKDFVRISNKDCFENDQEINKKLIQFFEELKKTGAEFGYRTASEIYRFVAIAHELKVDWDTNQLIDVMVMQKLLPKLHGSRKKIQPVLNTLWNFCLNNDENEMIDKDSIDFEEQCIYPISAAKIWQMNKNAKDNGFTSYAEA